MGNRYGNSGNSGAAQHARILLWHQAIHLLQRLQVLVDQAVDHAPAGFHLVNLANHLYTDIHNMPAVTCKVFMLVQIIYVSERVPNNSSSSPVVHSQYNLPI